jgi:hypothetical protein
MASAAQRFSSEVLSSYSNVRQFFRGQSSIEQLKRESESPQIVHGHRWSCWYKHTQPLLFVYAVFLNRILFVLEHRNAAKLAASVAKLKDKIIAKYIARSIQLGPAQEGNPLLLIPTRNLPAPGTEDVSRHPPISYDKIPDRRLQKRTFRDPVSFNPEKGICRGSSFWFLYLYLQTRPLFTNPQDHAVALGKLFALGAPREAVLLQSLYIKKGKLLNVRVGTLDHPRTRHPLETISIDNTGKVNAIEGKTKINNLPTGAYFIGLALHACAYIKIDQTLAYFFDPNRGIYEIRGRSQGEQLLPFFKPIYMEDNRPIEFYPIQNRITA